MTSIPRLCCLFLFVFWLNLVNRGNADFIIDIDSSSQSSNAAGFGTADTSLNKSFTANEISGDGFALLDVSSANGTFAESTLDILFTVSQPTSYALSASLTGFVNSGTATSSLSLVGPDTNIQLSFDPNFASIGMFQVGQYHLIATARVDQDALTAQAGAQFFVTISTITAVPEPSACILACIALGGLACRRKSRANLSRI